MKITRYAFLKTGVATGLFLCTGPGCGGDDDDGDGAAGRGSAGQNTQAGADGTSGSAGSSSAGTSGSGGAIAGTTGDGGSGPDSGGASAGETGEAPNACANQAQVGWTDLGADHVHEVLIPTSDVAEMLRAGEAMHVYLLGPAAGHSHILSVTLENFERLADGATVTVRSSFDDEHAHDILLRCG